MSEFPLTPNLPLKPSIRLDFAIHFDDRRDTPSIDYALGDYARSKELMNDTITVTVQGTEKDDE
jgi:hypothetical protein